jgi:ribose transport system substrate-binding protein
MTLPRRSLNAGSAQLRSSEDKHEEARDSCRNRGRSWLWITGDGAEQTSDSDHREGYDVTLLADRAGARKAGQDLGVEVTELGARSESDIAGQINDLKKAAASNPAAIVIAPADAAALGKPIEEVAENSRVVSIGSEANLKAVTSFVMADNEQAGRTAADILAAAIKRTYADAEGDVAVITASPTSFDRRVKGFKEQIAARYGALAMVAEKVGDGNPATGYKIMMDLIAAQPELRGVFSSDLVMTEGAAQAVAEAKTNKTGDTINLVGYGSDDKLVKFLQDGTIAALVVQDPFRLGYEGIKTALAASKGERVPVRVDIGAQLITKANITSGQSQELLKPSVK